MKYISILRGINVGGFRKIKMADLRSLYELMGFENVVTYIQSGNVIFETENKNKEVLKSKIEKAIEKKYRFFVPVEIRTNSEIKNIIKNCPFGSIDPVEEGTRVSVTFLSSKPSEVKVFEIQKHIFTPDKLVIKGEEAYLYCPNGYGKSKLSNAFLEKKLGVSATTRNWKSVHKLYELSLQ